jgi:hypothetical protein
MEHRRGPSKRLTPEQVAHAAELRLADFAWLHGLSLSTVRGLVAQGLPVFRYPGRVTVSRVEGAAWLERFRSDRVSRLVDATLADLRRA